MYLLIMKAAQSICLTHQVMISLLAQIGPLLDALNSELNPDELLGVNSPLSKDEFPVSDSFPRSTHLNPPGFENSESDEVIKFIDGVLNLDDVPPGEFHDVNNVLVNPGLESAHPNMLHEYSNWGVTGEEDYGWTYAPGPELQVLQVRRPYFGNPVILCRTNATYL